jgi:hypothetical protein
MAVGWRIQALIVRDCVLPQFNVLLNQCSPEDRGRRIDIERLLGVFVGFKLMIGSVWGVWIVNQ